MTDRYGRVIDYMRVSVTPRCNLRCRYCMPDGAQPGEPVTLLPFQELLRLCEIAASLGICRFKITGGEPLVRPGCAEFIARLRTLPGVAEVTLTTNGLLLESHLDTLCAAGLDAVNISLDTLSDTEYRALTGYPGGAADTLRRALEASVRRGLRVKTNTVLLKQTFSGIEEIAQLAREWPVDVRFIELMPMGAGGAMTGVPAERALARLKARWPDLHPVREARGNGPARYFASRSLRGRIGLIDAVSHPFCEGCNRVRLTAAGRLKPCLCYDQGADLGGTLRGGASDKALRDAMLRCIRQKPQSHCFSRRGEITEHRAMYEIGG